MLLGVAIRQFQTFTTSTMASWRAALPPMSVSRSCARALADDPPFINEDQKSCGIHTTPFLTLYLMRAVRYTSPLCLNTLSSSPSAMFRSLAYHKSLSMAITVFSNTFAPLVISVGDEYSFGLWLIPSLLGIKSRPTGPNLPISWVSWPAPLCILM